MKTRFWVFALALPIVVLGVSVVAAQEGPEEIILEHHNLFPEGIEYDEAGQRFLLSSATEGTIHEVADDGSVQPFIEDEDLTSSAGIEIDHINNRLLVAIGDPRPFFVSQDPDASKQAWLGSYDLETGARIFLADLSEAYPNSRGNLANDVAVDAAGNAYVTDTVSPVIYRVDMEGEVSVFLEDQAFSSINGIVAHPEGYLLLGAADGLLLKVPLDQPEVIPVELPRNVKFEVTDGMILQPDGSLVMVTFPMSIIYRLTSDDQWASATRLGVSKGHQVGWGTTVALRGDSVYVIYSYLNYWMDSLGDRDTFKIVRVDFKDR